MYNGTLVEEQTESFFTDCILLTKKRKTLNFVQDYTTEDSVSLSILLMAVF